MHLHTKQLACTHSRVSAECYGSFTFRLGFVHPLQDSTLNQCPPLSSLCCFPDPGASLLPCYVVLPYSAWSSPWSLPSPWLPLCAVFGPPIVHHSRYMSGPSPLLFQCVFYDVSYFFVFFPISEHGILPCNFRSSIFLSTALWVVLSLFVICLLRDHVWQP